MPTSTSESSSDADLMFLASTVDGLRLRIGPDLEAPALVFPCNPAVACNDPVTMNDGWKALALAGPVAEDGYDWYLVLLDPVHPGSAHLGWAATPHSGDPWLVPAEYECPDGAVDLETAISMTAVPLLYCSGDEPLTFDGYVVQGFGCNVMGTFEPDWLAHPCANMSYISPVAATDGAGLLFLHYPAPGVTNPTLELDAAQHVRITGHFDDPAAQGCSISPDDEPEIAMTARDAIADVAVCRMRFVVTEVVVDPTN